MSPSARAVASSRPVVAVAGGYGGSQAVEHGGGLARLGAAGHEHIEPGHDAGIQKTRCRRGECAEADQFVEMELVSDGHDPKDDRTRRSHLGLLITRRVNKLVMLPVLKDHGSAGAVCPSCANRRQ